MDDVKAELLIAIQEERFQSYIYEKFLADRNQFSKELTKSHNEGIVDVVSAFKEFKNNNNKAHDFSLAVQVFEKILPEIDAPILKVMECILHLVDEADQDVPADLLYTPYVDFCSAEVSRPKEALTLIETSIPQLTNFLIPTIVAGSRVDIDFYLEEAIRLAFHQDIEIRKKAIISFERIQYPQKSSLPEQALITLENSIKQETDDDLIDKIIKSAFSLYKHEKSLEIRVTELIDAALTKGGDNALHAASEIFWRYYNEISESLLDVLLMNLKNVKPSKKGTLSNIDYGLANLLGREDPEKGIQFIETLLVVNADTLSLQVFNAVIRELIKNNENLLNRLMTRWFLRGDSAFCNAIHEIVSHGNQHNMLLAVMRPELPFADFPHIVFLARKAIGYLFLYPVTAASIIVSLIPHAGDDEVTKVLTDLLFDPLLLNYPGEVKDYLKRHAESENDSIRKACREAMVTFERYLDDLKATGDIPELYPSQSQREAHWRHFSRQMAASMKEAESESVFLSLVSKSVLLYGRKSINYVYGPGDQAKRMEIPLHSHSTEMEFPRSLNIDPFGLDLMLRVFQAEKIKT